MRRACPRSAKIRRPDGVSLRFQVSRNSVEPSEAIPARNLLSKQCCRAALSDEPKPRRPEMTGIVEAFAFSGSAEWLAGAGSRPKRLIVSDACETQREGPATDAGEEMALGVSGEVAWLNVLDVSFVNEAWRDESSADEFSEPSGSEAVVLVVVRTHIPLRASRSA